MEAGDVKEYVQSYDKDLPEGSGNHYDAPAEKELNEAKAALIEMGVDHKIIDITDETQIGDKDLGLLLSNQNIPFQKLSDPRKHIHFGWAGLFNSVPEVRSALSTGAATSYLPHIISNGICVASYHAPNWIVSGNVGAEFQNWLLAIKQQPLDH